jgi:DNA/RNA endonuclease G (NUC1)
MRGAWACSGCLALVVAFATPVNALTLSDCVPLPGSLVEDSIAEHMFGGSPDGSAPTARRGYVFTFNESFNVPSWAAWHSIKEYRDTPKREGRWADFRTDASMSPVKPDDYNGWFDSEKNYARGHIVPYFISGGDRDGDGTDAEFESSLKIEDEDDACTVFEINAMSNIAPQFHDLFNGQPGVWWLLETDVRNMVEDGKEFQEIAGSIFVDGLAVEKIGDREAEPSTWSIGVPHGFFKIIVNVDRQEAVGFLFDHSGDVPNGCDIHDKQTVSWPSDCIVPIEQIEQATGLKFFTDLTAAANQRLRKASARETWIEWLNLTM